MLSREFYNFYCITWINIVILRIQLQGYFIIVSI